jgi:FKBP-type peptidyl-prolyl cis-trans isomerase 2
VVLDANHPLAGIALRLDIRVHAVREATLDEIDKGTLGAGFFKLHMPAEELDDDTDEVDDIDYGEDPEAHTGPAHAPTAGQRLH